MTCAEEGSAALMAAVDQCMSSRRQWLLLTVHVICPGRRRPMHVICPTQLQLCNITSGRAALAVLNQQAPE
jgi:hypothetical protein